MIIGIITGIISGFIVAFLLKAIDLYRRNTVDMFYVDGKHALLSNNRPFEIEIRDSYRLEYGQVLKQADDGFKHADRVFILPALKSILVEVSPPELGETLLCPGKPFGIEAYVESNIAWLEYIIDNKIRRHKKSASHIGKLENFTTRQYTYRVKYLYTPTNN